MTTMFPFESSLTGEFEVTEPFNLFGPYRSKLGVTSLPLQE